MKMLFASLIIAVGALLLIPGCQQNNENHKAKEETVIQTTLGNLPKFINLPATPIEVKWQTEELPHDNWSLTAMLQFNKSDFDKILSQSPQVEAQDAPTKILNRYLFNLLPKSIAQQYENHKNIDYITVDAYTVKASAFIDPEGGPLTYGDAVVFEKENLFLLHLSTL